MSCFIELNSLYLKNPVYDKEHKVNKRKSVSDLGKLKLLNNDLITSASTGFFFRLGLFNNFLEASTMLRTKSESLGSSKLARLCAHIKL